MKPTRVVHFGADAFGTQAACLGQQVAAIVASIDKVLPNLRWYAADVECTGAQFTHRTPTAVGVGDADAFMHVALQVDQFTSGVFVGIPVDLAQPRFREGGLWTDDDESADLGDAVVEVRAFDTTYVSVASTNEALLHRLESEFAG
ncbi:MAG: hypothetical protein MJE77_40440 [Proteobacteria bacterium]|nr:hypothetical protein [Pseudomonadota bacterium]